MGSTGIFLNKLVLGGHRKNYVVPFSKGVNIIYGDADTGKSSILRLIDYLLGSKTIHLDLEITSSVTYAALDLCINDKSYTIIRDIFNPDRKIDVYPSCYEEIDSVFPSKLAPKLSDSSTNEISISEFLLGEMGFPAISLKQAPSKDESRLARLSFRDIFKYCYLNQDDVGSKKMLDIGNYVLETKNREVFKYIFNLLDTNIADLDDEISKKSTEANLLEVKRVAIHDFLNETEARTLDELNDELETLESSLEESQIELAELNTTITSNTNGYEIKRQALDDINTSINDTEIRLSDAHSKLEMYTRLHNDYCLDLEKLKALNSATNIIGTHGAQNGVCPVCENELDEQRVLSKFTISDMDKISSEQNSIKRRISDLAEIVSDYRSQLTSLQKELESLTKAKKAAQIHLDEALESSISPYLTQRDAIVTEVSRLNERRETILREIKISHQYAILEESVSRLRLIIQKLKGQRDKLAAEAPSLDELLSSLSDALNSYLDVIHIKNKTGITIDSRSFLPVVRDTEYRNINSGGLRTIVSIGYFAIILRTLLRREINHPGILMIDTVGKFLGKTSDKYKADTDSEFDEEEGVSDPSKYAHIYEYLIGLANEFETNGMSCQILLVDNDIPPDIPRKYQTCVVAHYSSEGLNGLPVGLIDDWDSFVADTVLE